MAATDLEADVTAPVDAEYDTDELAELPTDSDSRDSRVGARGRFGSTGRAMTINFRKGRGK